MKIGGKALPHHGCNGKIPGGIPHLRHHHDDGLDTDRTEKPEKSVKIVNLLVACFLQRIWCKICSDHIR